MAQLRDLTGETFGNLTVTARTETINGRTHWLCRCTCGSVRGYLASNLTSGRTQSCGACGTTQRTGVVESALRYRITVWSGPASASGKPYSFGDVYDAQTDALVFRTTPPVYRETSKGEQHAGVTRCLCALAKMGRIGQQNGRTFKRWALEEGCVADVRACSTEDETMERWYEVTGEPRPAPPELHPAQGARRGVPLPETTPDQQAAIAALLEEWGVAEPAPRARVEIPQPWTVEDARKAPAPLSPQMRAALERRRLTPGDSESDESKD